MPYFNIDILKRNVRMLMEKRGMKQEDLAIALDMSQSNVSKALSLSEKKCFTLEQTCNIADYFHVSVDWLVGKQMSHSAVNNREIAEMLVTLIESGAVSLDTIKMTEREIPPEPPFVSPYDPRFERTDPHDVEMEYPALYFRNYWMPTEIDFVTGDDFEIQEYGNYTHNCAINEFLRKFIQIYTIYKRHELYEDTYREIVKDYLDRVKPTSPDTHGCRG